MKNLDLWKITYSTFSPKEQKTREALLTLANGYFGTRGTFCEASASDVFYPGTYLAGVYNKLSTNIAGRKVYNEDLINSPNWLPLTFKVEEGEFFYPNKKNIISYKTELNMKEGTLFTEIRVKDQKERITKIQTWRIVSMANPHFGVIRYLISPENYSGEITVRSGLDGSVENKGVERYKDLSSKHLKLLEMGSFGSNGIYLTSITNQSKIQISEASKIFLLKKGKKVFPKIKVLKEKEKIFQEFKINAQKNQNYEIEKVVSIYTSRDLLFPQKAAIASLKNIFNVSKLFEDHKKIFAELWEKTDIKIDGDEFSQKALRFTIFHLLQTATIHNQNIDAGFPARGLTGEAYRGHIFWDEIFVLPFYNQFQPEITKALLLYRYRRLPQAKANAKKEGFKGAMFPWQSASSGKEETQVLHLNPISRKWDPDYSRFQRHISFDVAYNVWRYWKETNDTEFLREYGAEMILEIANFGASLTRFEKKDKRYHTYNCMGPDEFHEKYPDKNTPGLKDNTYTNLMISWTLMFALEILENLPLKDREQLLNKTKLRKKDFKKWEEISKKMNIVINKEGIIAQFDGYFELKELDFEKYKEKYGNIQRMDRILKAEGKSPDEYKVSKQADTLMFFFLFPFEEVKKIFSRLGYSLSEDLIKKNYQYYLKRTTHGSTLSRVVYGYLAQVLGFEGEAKKFFKEILSSDLYDIQGGTTSEGIHTGTMGGAEEIVKRGFSGIDLLSENLKISPHLPKNWRKVELNFLYQKNWFFLDISKKKIKIKIKNNL